MSSFIKHFDNIEMKKVSQFDKEIQAEILSRDLEKQSKSIVMKTMDYLKVLGSSE